MGYTQKEILTALEKSGCNKWNLRQMTKLRSEGFLPKLTRTTQLGTNKPLNVWDEKDIDQIVDVYDWWNYCDGDRATLTLALWLDGYELPLNLLRHIYIPIIEAYLQKLTGGKIDPDDILDKVSEIVVISHIPQFASATFAKSPIARIDTVEILHVSTV